MQPLAFQVDAIWDSEAGVWIATSDDVPGLVAEADTIDALAEKLRIMVPDLLDANSRLTSCWGQGALDD